MSKLFLVSVTKKLDHLIPMKKSMGSALIPFTSLTYRTIQTTCVLCPWTGWKAGGSPWTGTITGWSMPCSGNRAKRWRIFTGGSISTTRKISGAIPFPFPMWWSCMKRALIPPITWTVSAFRSCRASSAQGRRRRSGMFPCGNSLAMQGNRRRRQGRKRRIKSPGNRKGVDGLC